MMSRAWHKNFEEYVEYIANHKDYKGLFIERKNDETLKWVVTGKSKHGQIRKEWWNQQCIKHGIKIESGCYAKIARKIHPTKMHTCQICGEQLSIEYIYPASRTINFLNKKTGLGLEAYDGDIFDAIDAAVYQDHNNLHKIAKYFKCDNVTTVSSLKERIQKEHVDQAKKSFLSPGVMSNSPDRFDGFHSDGACCRSESDKGRHKSNLSRYNQDRRAFENWADGDWKKADRLMSQFSNHGVSADHIGPISLGFCHRPKFIPLSKEENSSKNNRMSLSDIMILIDDEKSGDKVISWHSKKVWDLLKNKAQSDYDAKNLSKIMRENLHQVLTLFSKIEEMGGRDLLETFLNPQYSFYDYKFNGFNPATGEYQSVDTRPLSGQNQKNNVERYYRIAFETLEEYSKKDNRRLYSWSSEAIDKNVESIGKLLSNGNMLEAKNLVQTTVDQLGEINAKRF